MSCLHLAAYLASWGMYRGSSHLLQRSIRYYVGLIEVLQDHVGLFDIDISDYGKPDNRKSVVNCFNSIWDCLEIPTQTLVTKIMLGVFGCVPALDIYVKKTLGIKTINESALNSIFKFYENNSREIDSFTVYTLNFADGEDTKIKYKQAKIIDMYAFIDEQNNP